jgi:hypothetical protein
VSALVRYAARSPRRGTISAAMSGIGQPITNEATR